MTSLFEMVALAAIVVLVASATIWMVRQIMRDGYGFNAAPRGSEDWSALGLPSRPYGT